MKDNDLPRDEALQHVDLTRSALLYVGLVCARTGTKCPTVPLGVEYCRPVQDRICPVTRHRRSVNKHVGIESHVSRITLFFLLVAWIERVYGHVLHHF